MEPFDSRHAGFAVGIGKAPSLDSRQTRLEGGACIRQEQQTLAPVFRPLLLDHIASINKC